MKKYLFLFLGSTLLCLCSPRIVLAWDGFDAASADLVEVTPDHIPAKGDTVTVRNYDTENTQVCLVESVTRNTRTIELVVRTPTEEARTLVMEGR